MQFVESCAWLPATRRHLVCRSRTASATGVHEGLGIFSFRPEPEPRYVPSAGAPAPL